MSYKKDEKIDPITQWGNYKKKILTSEDERAKEMLKICDTWLFYSSTQKQQAWKEWKDYYEECSTSEPAAIFWEMRDEFHKVNKDMTRIKELANKAKAIREKGDFIPTPSLVDPFTVYGNQTCHTYLRLFFEAEKHKRVQEKERSGIF